MSRITTHPKRTARRRNALDQRNQELARWQKAKTQEDAEEILGHHIDVKDVEKFIASKVKVARADVENLEQKVL